MKEQADADKKIKTELPGEGDTFPASEATATDENDQKKASVPLTSAAVVKEGRTCHARKRKRCDSSSPIRRLQEVSMAVGISSEHHNHRQAHAPKRQRTILSPVPARRPPSQFQWQRQQQQQQQRQAGRAQLQSSSDGYYGRSFHPTSQQQASYWQPHEYRNGAVVRDYSPTRNNHTTTITAFPSQA